MTARHAAAIRNLVKACKKAINATTNNMCWIHHPTATIACCSCKPHPHDLQSRVVAPVEHLRGDTSSRHLNSNHNLPLRIFWFRLPTQCGQEDHKRVHNKHNSDEVGPHRHDTEVPFPLKEGDRERQDDQSHCNQP